MDRILLLDDEQNILNALRRELGKGYEIETFTRPAEALERCREVPFDLVISDYKMPDMNGIEFLNNVGKILPDAGRLLLSGQADVQALDSAINESHVYRFISKPWNSAELKSSISQALSYRNILLDNRRMSAAYRDRYHLPDVHEIGGPYHIILVDNSEDSLEQMWNMSGHVLQQDIQAAIWQDLPQLESEVPLDINFVLNTFSSAQDALEYAGQNLCDLVIASHTMPDMEAMDFFKRFRQIQPDAARLLVSNNPDIKTMSQAINEAEVDSFLYLSWDQACATGAEGIDLSWNACQLKIASLKALVAHDLLLENRRMAELLRKEA